MEAGKHRWVIAVMTLNAFLFGGIFLVLGFYNRLSADDYHYFVTTQERGIWGAMVMYYQHWNPRWASTLVLNALLLAHAKSQSLLLMHGLTLILGWGSFVILFRGLENRFDFTLSVFQRAILPLYLLMVLFYVSFAKDDTWFWMSSTPMYLWGVFAVALGFGLLFMRSVSMWHLPVLVLIFLYVGGSSEPVAIVTLLVLFYLGIVRGNGKSRKLYHLATISCLVGFVLDVAGSGVQVRLDHLPQLSISDRLLVGAKNYGRLVLMKLPILLPVLIATLLPVAMLLSGVRRWQAATFKELFVANRHVFALGDLIMLAVAFMMGLVMSENGPPRAWLPISAMLVVCSGALFCQMGELLNRLFRQRLFLIVMVAQTIVAGFQISFAAQMVPIAIVYSASVDNRMRSIQESVANADTLIMLQPLADAGWLHSAEISADTSDFRNRHLGLYFGGQIRLFTQESIISVSE